MPATPTQQPRHPLPGEALWALRRGEALAIYVLGDLRQAVAGLAEAIHAGRKGGGRGALVVTRYGPTSARRAGHAPSPMERPIDLCTRLVPIDGAVLHQQTHDVLAGLRGRFRGVP